MSAAAAGAPRVGIVGAGRMGRHHADAYRAEGAAIVAVHDADADGARAFADELGARACDTLDALLTAGVDAISVCTPPVAHAAAAVPALDAGIHVLCEKPLAGTIEDARAIVAAARRSDAVATVAFFNRWFEPVARLRQLLAERRDDFGRVVRVEVALDLGRQPPRAWQWDRAVAGGGALMNNGVHALDLFRIFAGEPIAGTALLRPAPHAGRAAETDAWVLVHGADGAVGVLQTCSSTAVRTFRLHVECERGAGEVLWYPPSLTIACDGRPPETVPIADADPLARIRAGVAAFLHAAREADASTVPSAADGLRAVELVHALYGAAAAGAFASLAPAAPIAPAS